MDITIEVLELAGGIALTVLARRAAQAGVADYAAVPCPNPDHAGVGRKPRRHRLLLLRRPR